MKKQTKLTGWFSGIQKPAYVGVYQRLHNKQSYFAFWNGNYWCRYQSIVDHAYDVRDCRSIFDSVPWRGLASNPEVSK
jgi:hypothetical protein